MRKQTIYINVDDDVWENAVIAFDMAGLTVSEGISNFLKRLPPPPDSIVVRNNEELLRKLEEAEAYAESGHYSTADEVFERLNKKYGLQA